MIVSPMPLTPDEEPQERLELHSDRVNPGEPYLLTALLAALAVAVVAMLCGAFAIGAVALGLAGGGVLYSYFLVAQPRLPLTAITVATAEISMLCSRPLSEVAFKQWLDPRVVVSLLLWAALAGFAGYLLALAFDVKQRPNITIGLTFLMLFVVTNLHYFSR